MDIIRKKTSKNSFNYYNKKTNKKISNKYIISRIDNLKIPPGYTNVIIASDTNSKIQATGRDDQHRKQYVYNSIFLEEQQDIKFADLIKFGKKLKRIRTDIYHNITNIKNPLSKEKIISIIIFLMDKCHFRIGSEKYKQLYNTHGVSTLNSNHFLFKKKSLLIKFIGKKGVLNSNTISNKYAIEYLNYLCSLNSKYDYIFYYEDEQQNKYHISDKQINKYLQKYNQNISAKFFRTWVANHTVISELLSKPKPKNIAEATKNTNSVIKIVAKKLNNTTKVSKKNYINNEIIQLYISHPNTFFQIIKNLTKKNGKLPTVDRILIRFLEYITKT